MINNSDEQFCCLEQLSPLQLCCCESSASSTLQCNLQKNFFNSIDKGNHTQNMCLIRRLIKLRGQGSQRWLEERSRSERALTLEMQRATGAEAREVAAAWEAFEGLWQVTLKTFLPISRWFSRATAYTCHPVSGKVRHSGDRKSLPWDQVCTAFTITILTIIGMESCPQWRYSFQHHICLYLRWVWFLMPIMVLLFFQPSILASVLSLIFFCLQKWIVVFLCKDQPRNL